MYLNPWLQKSLGGDAHIGIFSSSDSSIRYLLHTGVEVSAGTERDWQAGTQKAGKLKPAEDAGVPFYPGRSSSSLH